MKKLIYSLIALSAILASCSDEAKTYVNMADNALVLTPAPGGAVLHYVLPNDPDIVGIHVRYTDCYGDPILRTGSAFSDSLTLVGFNEATANVPAEITLQLRTGGESEPIHKTFSTLDSAPIQFINSMKVESGWNGFSINYSAPEEVKGLYHVYYLATNPYTNLPDTILLETKNIAPGGDTIIYNPQQLLAENTIVVKAEDYRGHIVKQRQWDVMSMQTEKHDGIKIFYNNSLEDDNEKVGIQYLTDGDYNGHRWFESQDDHKFYTFMSKKGAYGEGSEPMYIDIGERTPCAEVRFYVYRFKGTGYGECYSGQPCWGSTYCYYNATNIVGQQTNSCYYNRLPCDLEIYGCREDGDPSNFEGKKWEKIGSFSEDPTLPESGVKNLWFYGSWDTRPYGTGDADAETVKALDPVYLSVGFMAAGQEDGGFRFLKIKFNDSYRYEYEYANGTNTLMKVLTFNELEVYTKKK